MSVSPDKKIIIEDIIKNNKSFIYQDTNPKKQGKSTYDRYNIYKTATNYKEFLKLGGIRSDFYVDFKNKYFILDDIDYILDSSNENKNIIFNLQDNINNNIINIVDILDNNVLNTILENQLYFIECIKNKLNSSTIKQLSDNSSDNNNSDNDEELSELNDFNFFNS